ncbi:MAG: DUF402 domain-containing protein [Gemmatimonadota bacterium]|nr:DUF402 domain-containing protein [Gemmatimonadota bacterium]MDE3007298.1 DUF402 domain-containing protein [Gemmatimonadota bacterium]MDE3014013.1 DUF402 domain-containing protein [Gemmatimonadota bacterium]
MSPNARVAIHYRRPPNRVRIYEQRVVHEEDDVIVTLSQPVETDTAMYHDTEVILERDSLALWFTFPDVWHDIGRFHRADRTFTGLYANILTPPVIDGPIWHTTDLFLDVWQTPSGVTVLLDEDEFSEAREQGLMDPPTATRAWDEGQRILSDAAQGTWPPQCVKEWTLERALEVLGDA